MGANTFIFVPMLLASAGALGANVGEEQQLDGDLVSTVCMLQTELRRPAPMHPAVDDGAVPQAVEEQASPPRSTILLAAPAPALLAEPPQDGPRATALGPQSHGTSEAPTAVPSTSGTPIPTPVRIDTQAIPVPPSPPADAIAKQQPNAETDGDAGGTHSDHVTSTESPDSQAEHQVHTASSTSQALSLELIAMMIVIMTLFYLVNFPDEVIRHETWKILSATVSIFSAITLFDAIKKTTMWLWDEPVGPQYDGYHPPPPWSTTACDFSRLLAIFALFQLVLVLVRGKQWVLDACGSLGSRVVGFASVAAFGTLQQYKPFCDNPFAAFLEALLSSLVLLLICFCFAELTVRVGSEDAHGAWGKWAKTCAASENQAAAVTIGFLICQVVKFQIVGHLSPVEGAPKGKTNQEVWALLACGVVFAVFSVFETFGLDRATKRGYPRRTRRIIEVAQRITSMSSGWCLLYWGQWLFWSRTNGAGVGEGDKMTARLLMGLAFAVLGVIAIFFLREAGIWGYLEEDSLRALVDTVGMLLGLSWKACFAQAVSGISPGGDVAGIDQRLVEAFVSAVLVVVVTPAWALYILPKSLEAVVVSDTESDHEKPPAQASIMQRPQGFLIGGHLTSSAVRSPSSSLSRH